MASGGFEVCVDFVLKANVASARFVLVNRASFRGRRVSFWSYVI